MNFQRKRYWLVGVSEGLGLVLAAELRADGADLVLSGRAVDQDQLVVMRDVNFTGCARVIGAVLPAMVARGQGHVVITGSLSGFRGLPGALG